MVAILTRVGEGVRVFAPGHMIRFADPTMKAKNQGYLVQGGDGTFVGDMKSFLG